MRRIKAAPIDTSRIKAEYRGMNSHNDKYYIDAKVSALDHKFEGELKSIHARIDILEIKMEAGFRALREEFEAKFAKLEERVNDKLNATVKWVIATVLGGVILNTSIMVALLNRPAPAAQTTTPTTLNINTQPAPSAQPSPEK